MIERVRHCAVVAAIAFLCAGRPAAAQLTLPDPAHYTEYRGDAIVARGTTAQLGAGEVVPIGFYVRFSVDGAAGATWRDGATHASGRVDALARFIFDPLREVPVGLSLGGGLTVPYVSGDKRVRPLIAAVIDVEGRMHGPITPAIQIGLGGGARVGFVLRTSALRWR
jgi:hypothetical protein